MTEIKLKYLFYQNWKYTWEFTYSSETAKKYAKIKWCYIMYDVNWEIIDPLNK